MNRREFITTSAAIIAASRLSRYETLASQIGANKRVGLIGTGWYGKCDLLRLIQVAPVEVVSLCDVDSQMLADAADIVATRQASKKKPRLYGDYREMLKEKDLDIVLIGTPDHWHALPMIAAVRSRAPTSTCRSRSASMSSKARRCSPRRASTTASCRSARSAAARRTWSKRATQIIETGKLGKIGLVEIYCYYHMRATEQSARHGAAAESRLRDVDRPRADAAVQRAGASAQLARVHGIRQRHRRRHVRPHVRHGALDAGPGLAQARRFDAAASSWTRTSKANITDTQTATFDFGDLQVVWQHRTWGDAPDPKYPWGATFYGDKGTLKASVMSYDFMPAGQEAQPIHEDVVYELEQVSRGQDREGSGDSTSRPAIRAAHAGLSRSASTTRGKPVADIEQGYISTASCILANMSMQLGRVRSTGTTRKGWSSATMRPTSCCAGRIARPWVHPDPKTV